VGEFRSPTADFAFYHSLNIRKKQFFDAANWAERRQKRADQPLNLQLFRKNTVRAMHCAQNAFTNGTETVVSVRCARAYPHRS
jgi:hypothetical protein